MVMQQKGVKKTGPQIQAGFQIENQLLFHNHLVGVIFVANSNCEEVNSAC